MSLEQPGLHTAEQHEELTPLRRFIQLLGFMKEYAEGDGHWRQLPPVELKIKSEPPIVTRFFIYLPELARYSPSIIMDVGSREPEPETGRLHGEVEQVYVRKNFLKRSSAYYSKFHRQAEDDLEKIEEMFYVYRNAIEVSLPNGQK
ncbi:MAG: hypothetical protein WDZ34_02375 [Candidatus Saccharimonadales bacterium]